MQFKTWFQLYVIKLWRYLFVTLFIRFRLHLGFCIFLWLSLTIVPIRPINRSRYVHQANSSMANIMTTNPNKQTPEIMLMALMCIGFMFNKGGVKVKVLLENKVSDLLCCFFFWVVQRRRSSVITSVQWVLGRLKSFLDVASLLWLVDWKQCWYLRLDSKYDLQIFSLW